VCRRVIAAEIVLSRRVGEFMDSLELAQIFYPSNQRLFGLLSGVGLLLTDKQEKGGNEALPEFLLNCAWLIGACPVLHG